ncbi:hypothetical protein HaLaN_22030, partial [Haematococcus lacustris]
MPPPPQPSPRRCAVQAPSSWRRPSAAARSPQRTASSSSWPQVIRCCLTPPLQLLTSWARPASTWGKSVLELT